MLSSNIPLKLQKAFAAGAGGSYRTAIPVASQIGITAGRASLTDGFPPVNFLPVAGGGVPPYGADVNGILYEISSWTLWQQAGGAVYFDATFAASIGGYPKDAVLSSTTSGVLWLCTADNNSTDPDGGSAANWTALLPVKSTIAQALAGTDDTTFMTPAKVHAAIAGAAPSGPTMLLAQNGYYVFPGGFIQQWGRASVFSSGTPSPVSFTEAFPNTCFSVVCSGTQNANQDNPAAVMSGTITPSGFNVSYRGGGVAEVNWQATGY